MLFKTTTRRSKGSLKAHLSSEKYEGFIHEARPIIERTDDGSYLVHLPSPHGAALVYGVTWGSNWASETEATEAALAQMKRDGWRETREQAEADAAAEIEYRTNFRADGKPRH